MRRCLEACAAGCGTYSSKLLQCSRCHMVRYCGQECQKRHWKQHKKECALRLEERKKGAKGAGGAPLTAAARERTARACMITIVLVGSAAVARKWTTRACMRCMRRRVRIRTY